MSIDGRDVVSVAGTTTLDREWGQTRFWTYECFTKL